MIPTSTRSWAKKGLGFPPDRRKELEKEKNDLSKNMWLVNGGGKEKGKSVADLL